MTTCDHCGNLCGHNVIVDSGFNGFDDDEGYFHTFCSQECANRFDENQSTL